MEYAKPVEVSNVRMVGAVKSEISAYMPEERAKGILMNHTRGTKTVYGTNVQIDTYLKIGGEKTAFMYEYEEREDLMIGSLLRFKSYVIEVLCELENIGISNFFADAWHVNKEDITTKINELFSFSIKDDFIGNRRKLLMTKCNAVLQAFQQPYEVIGEYGRPEWRAYKFFGEFYPDTFYHWQTQVAGHTDELKQKLSEFRENYEDFKNASDWYKKKYLGYSPYYHRIVAIDK